MWEKTSVMPQPLTPIVGRLRQENDTELAVSLGYKVQLCLKKKNQTNKNLTICTSLAFFPGVSACLTTREALPNPRLEGIHLKMKPSFAQWTPNLLEDPAARSLLLDLKSLVSFLYLGQHCLSRLG